MTKLYQYFTFFLLFTLLSVNTLIFAQCAPGVSLTSSNDIDCFNANSILNLNGLVNMNQILNFNTNSANAVRQTVNSGFTLAPNQNYNLQVSGTFSVWAANQWAASPCGNPITNANGNFEGHDNAFILANRFQMGAACTALPTAALNSRIQYSSDGTNWQNGTNPATPNANSTYNYNVTGQGQILRLRDGYPLNSITRDDYGILQVQVTGPRYSFIWDDGSTNTLRTVSPTQSSDYTVTVTDHLGNCTSILTTTVNVDLDLEDILTINEDDFLCPEEEKTLISSIASDFQLAVSSYQWFLDGNPIQGATTSTHTTSTLGIYTLEAYSDNGCILISNSIILDEETNTCACLEFDFNTTSIDQDLLINQNIFWHGKVIIDEGVTVTVNNATLDITNVDVILGECSKLEFINEAQIRANNSVFRSCNQTKTWGGLFFENSTNNIINECTFKNALVANYVGAGSNTDINNNLFENCQHSIYIDTDLQGVNSTSGNEITIQNDLPQVPTDLSCISSSYNISIIQNEPRGITSRNSDDLGKVLNNSFINNNDKIVFNGLSMINTDDFSIIGNHFINNHYSIHLSNSSQITSSAIKYISSNDIEQLSTTESSMGMRIERGNNIEISNNTITNVNNKVSEETSSYGLFVIWGNDKIRIKSNLISGYKNGIFAGGFTNSQIIDNTLTDIYEIAIRTNNAENTDVACNSIDLNNFNATISTTEKTGIGIASSRPNSGYRIHSNCITDCSNPLYVERIAGVRTLPEIRNNYLYNYSKFGIYVNDLTGDIGSVTQPAMNTFWSNSNDAVDIAAVNGTLDVYDNFGMYLINTNVNIRSNRPYHSTASCGKQILNTPSQGNLDEDLVCDNLDYILANQVSANVRSSDGISFTPNYQEVSSIEIINLSNESVEVYPNPTSDIINLRAVDLDDNTLINIVDNTGRIVKTVTPTINTGVISINLNSLSAGHYILNLIQEKGITSSKILKTE